MDHAENNVIDIQKTPDQEIHNIQIPIHNGILTCPDSWILLNPEATDTCSCVRVIECKNYEKYGIPHFVYLVDNLEINQYTAKFKEDIYRLCCKAWPRFKWVLKHQIPPARYNGNLNKRFYKKAQKHIDSPFIGDFPILAEDDDFFPKDGKTPFGARIVHNK